MGHGVLSHRRSCFLRRSRRELFEIDQPRVGRVRWIASEDLETTLKVLCDQLNDCGFAYYADRARGI